MTKTIKVIYEDGVFKPTQKVDLREGSEILIMVKKVAPDIQTTAKKILSGLDYLPRRKVNLKRAEELYHEGKIGD